MKLSTRGRYGINAMFELARSYGGAPMSIKAIAEKQGIPESYLEQLIALLRRDELVTGIRGAQGGYVLSREPENITVGDVLRSLEGDLKLVDCLIEEESCDKSCDCPSRIIWKKVSDGLNQLVDSITLKDMINNNTGADTRGENEK